MYDWTFAPCVSAEPVRAGSGVFQPFALRIHTALVARVRVPRVRCILVIMQYGKLSPSSRYTHSTSVLHLRTLVTAAELRPFFAALVANNRQRDAAMLHAHMHDQGIVSPATGTADTGELSARTLNILLNGIYVDLLEPM
jgi:hypothetical protein